MLTLKDIREYCAAKRGATEDFPFDQSTLVFKVGGRMFALTDIDSPQLYLNLKCDPNLSLLLRQKYRQVEPGYHMNKKHWNTIHIADEMPDEEILMLIDHSYELVIKMLPRKVRDDITGA